MTSAHTEKGEPMDDLISRQAAIRWVKTECNPYGKPTLDYESGKRVIEHMEQMPSAQPKIGRDCTDFIRWLMDEVMDEENWQMNAVANGEIICRKLKKLGMLDVVDGYYVKTQETGEWIKLDMHAHLADHKCTSCGQECYVPTCMGDPLYDYCPNCGAKMVREDGKA